MKIKAGNVGPGALPLARERVIVQENNGVLTAQKWPKKRGKAKSGYDFFRQQEFGIAAKMAITPLDLDYETAVNMVKGTSYVPRDFLVMCAYGRAYEIVMPDGTKWENFRDVTNNPQYVLDQVTDVPGSMLYRTEQGWVGLAPASDGLVLAMDQGLPQWRAGSALAGGYSWYKPPGFSTGPLAANFRGNIIQSLVDMYVDKLAPWVPATTTGTYTGSIWKFDSPPALGDLVATSLPFTLDPENQGYAILSFTPTKLLAGHKYLLGVYQDDIAPGQDSHIAIGTAESQPYPSNTDILGYYTSAGTPTPGMSLSANSRPWRIAYTMAF